MHRYIAHANIDHYLGLLNDHDLASDKRDVVTKLLIEEEDKLAHDLEQLQFAEQRAAQCRDRLKRLRQTVADTADLKVRAQGERLLANFEDLQRLIDEFCHRLRDRVNART